MGEEPEEPLCASYCEPRYYIVACGRWTEEGGNVAGGAAGQYYGYEAIECCLLIGVDLFLDQKCLVLDAAPFVALNVALSASTVFR
jgi:hypothetical protein